MADKTYTADEYGALEAKCSALQEALTESRGIVNDTLRANRLLQGVTKEQAATVQLLEQAQAHAESCVAEYVFAIGDSVWINGPEFRGVVTAQITDCTKRQYKVVWWNNGERKHEWLEEPEIRRA